MLGANNVDKQLKSDAESLTRVVDRPAHSRRSAGQTLLEGMRPLIKVNGIVLGMIRMASSASYLRISTSPIADFHGAPALLTPSNE